MAAKRGRQEYQATAQFYHVVTTNAFSVSRLRRAAGSTRRCADRAERKAESPIDDWYDVGGGESGYIAVRPDSPNVVFAGSYGGLLTRYDANTGLSRDVNPWPDNPMGHDAVGCEISLPVDVPDRVLAARSEHAVHGQQRGLQVDGRGPDWTAISPDLTRHDPRTLGASGGPITKDQTSVEYYGTVFTIAESPVHGGRDLGRLGRWH